MRLGITVTKKIGNAVIRNRMKRRFRALARDILPKAGFAGADHVLIGRAGGIERDFGALESELLKALQKLKGMFPGEGRGPATQRVEAAQPGRTGPRPTPGNKRTGGEQPR